VARIRKNLIVVGDRLLIRPRAGEQKTGGGLYLPATAVDSQQVRGGRVVKVGPGIPVPAPTEDEPWKGRAQPRYVPLQAQEGDYAVFLKKAAIEIRFEGEDYLIVPIGAVLVLEREEIDLGEEFGEADA